MHSYRMTYINSIQFCWHYICIVLSSARFYRPRDSRLPSFLLRNSFKEKKAKVQKEVQYTRDIMCIPSSFGEGGIKSIPIPRGKARSQLVKLGLQGKVTLSSAMSEEAIMEEIRSAFTEAMGNNPSFPFIFLQVSGCGTKTLAVPSLSASFKWSAQEVCKLGKQCIYILAQQKLVVEMIKVLVNIPKPILKMMY